MRVCHSSESKAGDWYSQPHHAAYRVLPSCAIVDLCDGRGQNVSDHRHIRMREEFD